MQWVHKWKISLFTNARDKYSKMELLVMDLTGLMTVPTWDSYQYALVIIEVSCRYVVGRLLREKDEAGVAVRDIVAMLECQSGLKACHLRSDNGSEFVNLMMTQFCQKNGVTLLCRTNF